MINNTVNTTYKTLGVLPEKKNLTKTWSLKFKQNFVVEI